MRSNTYLAHIAQDGREQTVQVHLTQTAALARQFAQPFGGEEQAELAGLLHDIGKYSDAFQKRLHGDTAKVDHATAGGIECMQMHQPLAAFAVMGHHGGLPDGGSQTDLPDEATFFARLKRQACGKLEPYDAWKQEIQPKPATVPAFVQTDPAAGMFFARMLYSCLVDADFLDTEAFMSGHARESGSQTTMESLWERLQIYLSDWFPLKNALNERRCAILKQCIRAGEEQAPGLFSLTVPTGGGKTVASLAFALAHARKQGFRRVIYVIPYTSIIEQTADVFRKILGDENVLEHHSNAVYDLENEADARNIRMAQATENWDMPVVVTTAVQFFESLYACRSSQCRKLHNLAGSVIVFDEAQMLPLPYLRPCVYAISQLTAHYHVSAVLCTATQPALQPIFHEFLPDSSITELCPPETCPWDEFRRVSFVQAGKLTLDALAAALNQKQQVLCIVNTRKTAQALFERMEGEGRFHLSTLMYPAHRRAQLREIYDRLDNEQPCRVVSTSLIEAGVDVDFPAVYRETAGLDSILQAAGRCNREGKNAAEDSIVTIFQGEARTPPLFAKAADIGKSVMSKHADIASRAAIHDYFHQMLDLTGKEAQDKAHILELMNSPRELFLFRKIADAFHLIDNPTRTVYIPQGEGVELTQRLAAGEHDRYLFRRLGAYGVSVYAEHFAALNAVGAVEVLADDTAVLRDLSLYDAQTGLSLEVNGGKAVFL